VEGLTIYYAHGGEGYLIASSQGEDHPGYPLANTFAVYHRNGNNEYVMSFKVIDNTALGVDGLSNTDGVGVVSAFLGSAFPKGVFVAQDGHNTGGNQNFKLVPWENIAMAVTPNLMIDTEWNGHYISEDLTQDGSVDIDDGAEFANQWLETTQLADTNNDRVVNFYDLRTLCSEWLRTGRGLQADFNRDRSVDFRDFIILGSKWQQNCFYLPADFNKDGRVDFTDFAELADEWLWEASWYGD
jgi:hypothetical protein